MTTENKVQGSDIAPQVASGGLMKRVSYFILSFVVGLSAFFMLKLAFMVPLNLASNPRNLELLQSISAIIVILSIYLAIKYTKILNRKSERKNRIKWRIATITGGFFSLIISNLILLFQQAL